MVFSLKNSSSDLHKHKSKNNYHSGNDYPIGGTFALELPCNTLNKNSILSLTNLWNLDKLNCSHFHNSESALYYLVIALSEQTNKLPSFSYHNKLWLPEFFDTKTDSALKKMGLKIGYYPLNNYFEPDLEFITSPHDKKRI